MAASHQVIRHTDYGGRIKAAAEFGKNRRLSLQPHGNCFTKKRAKLLLVPVLVPVMYFILDRQLPEPANARLLGRHAYGVTGRNRVNAFIWRAVRTSTEGQKSGDILLVKIRDTGRFDKRLQAAGPQNASRLHVVVKRTDAREVARENGGALYPVANDQAPIADQVN